MNIISVRQLELKDLLCERGKNSCSQVKRNKSLVICIQETRKIDALCKLNDTR